MKQYRVLDISYWKENPFNCQLCFYGIYSNVLFCNPFCILGIKNLSALLLIKEVLLVRIMSNDPAQPSHSHVETLRNPHLGAPPGKQARQIRDTRINTLDFLETLA